MSSEFRFRPTVGTAARIACCAFIVGYAHAQPSDEAAPAAPSGDVAKAVRFATTYTVFVPAEADFLGIGGIMLSSLELPRPSATGGNYRIRFEGETSPAGDKYQVKLCDGERRGNLYNAIECGLYEAEIKTTKGSGFLSITFADITYNPEYQPNKLDLMRFFGGKTLVGGANDTHLIKFLNTHTIQKTGEVYVPYPPDSVKANFDRKFKRDAGAVPLAMLNKFKGRYVFHTDNKITITAGLDFYPNKNGTVIEYHLVGYVTTPDATSVDWRGVFPKAIRDMERIGSL